MQQRKSSQATVQALDNALVHSRKRGLVEFVATEGANPAKRLRDRPLLVLHFDEGSPNLAAGQWLLYKAEVRMCFIRDVFHREWSDTCLAAKASGLWHVVLLTSVLHNLPYGP